MALKYSTPGKAEIRQGMGSLGEQLAWHSECVDKYSKCKY
jgi:hypothetical protein